MPPLAISGRQHQVFLERQAGENAALFGAVADAQVRNPVRRQADRLAAVDHDRAGALAGQAQDRAQRRGAPGAVAPEQRHHFAAVHPEIDAVQDVRLAVAGVQVLERRFGDQRSPALRAFAVADGAHVGFHDLRDFPRPGRRALRRGPRRAAAR